MREHHHTACPISNGPSMMGLEVAAVVFSAIGTVATLALVAIHALVGGGRR
jgi:hypothetical protein